MWKKARDAGLTEAQAQSVRAKVMGKVDSALKFVLPCGVTEASLRHLQKGIVKMPSANGNGVAPWSMSSMAAKRVKPEDMDWDKM